MRILMTGSSGFIGSALVEHFTRTGHSVICLVRSAPKSDHAQLEWNPATGFIPALPENLDAVIHLAGKNIAAGRWTAKEKLRIRNSRVEGTLLLCRALASLTQPPGVLVSASAVGYYGSRGEEVLNEESSAGSGFLAEVCSEWERTTGAALQRGIRVVNLRMGMVLSGRKGALTKMLPVFRLGLGGPIGTGKQYMSWIALEDLLGVVQHCLSNTNLRGPVIAASPNPVTNCEFVRTLGKVLHRPTFMRMPSLGARIVFGEMADEVLLASQRADPARLKSTGYQFRFPMLEEALRRFLVN